MATLRGRVKGLDGRPAWNATIVFSPTSGSGKSRFGLADEAGQFQVDGLVPGMYVVKVNQRYFQIFTFNMEIIGDEDGILIELEPDPQSR